MVERSDDLARLVEGFRGAPHAEEAAAWLLATCPSLIHPGGTRLMARGHAADHLLLVLRGRLVVVADGRTLNEVWPGETVGELGLLTDEVRSADVFAARDSTVLRVDAEAWRAFEERFPHVVLALHRELLRRLDAPRTGPRLRALSVAVIPIGDAPVEWFVQALRAALGGPGAGCALLADRGNGEPLGERLEAEEREHGAALLVTDGTASEWTRAALRHADRVLLVARGGSTPRCAPAEDLLDGDTPGARLEQRLVLVHPSDAEPPRGTAHWLDRRPLTGHHHVTEGDAASVERVVASLLGDTLGLALGGGGARGFAHLGVLEVLARRGVVVDRIAGTSMGAIVGAVAALHARPEGLDAAWELAADARRLTREVTLPVQSLLSGRTLDRLLVSLLDGRDLEDLRIPFLCVASSLSEGGPVVLERGPARQALRASAAVPIGLPPVVLDGALLIDGGMTDNLPVEPLRARGVSRVVAVNVSGARPVPPPPLPLPSPWRTLLDWLLPGRTPAPTLTLPDVLPNAIDLAAAAKVAESARHADLLVEPDLSAYGMFDLEAAEAIRGRGALAMEAVFEEGAAVLTRPRRS